MYASTGATHPGYVSRCEPVGIGWFSDGLSPARRRRRSSGVVAPQMPYSSGALIAYERQCPSTGHERHSRLADSSRRNRRQPFSCSGGKNISGDSPRHRARRYQPHRWESGIGHAAVSSTLRWCAAGRQAGIWRTPFVCRRARSSVSRGVLERPVAMVSFERTAGRGIIVGRSGGGTSRLGRRCPRCGGRRSRTDGNLS